jgi:penicillin-binding protein 1B
VRPNWVKLIRDDKGNVLYSYKPVRREALDPRITYLMVDLLQEVMRSGTAAGVRSRGFVLPAAGKTGTSRDGWFAGFTSRLICIVWVGFDDNRELDLEGARSALPIWTEFMKRAHRHREYRNVNEFEPPDGIVMVEVDPATGALAAPACPGAQLQAFLAGTQPIEVCRLHGGSLAGTTRVTGWETPSKQPATAAAQAQEPAGGASARHARSSPAPAAGAAQPAQSPRPAEKKSLFRRLLDVFK